jgi:CRP/FNR family transcriptional regulator, cyclic AMP receptor protein
MTEISAAQPLLTLDPELGQLLTAERWESAHRQLDARVVAIEPGPWRPEALLRADNAANVGLLLLAGTIVREIVVQDPPSAELFGPGDIVRTWRGDRPPEMLSTRVRWTAYEPGTAALLDCGSALALRRYPEVMAVILDRLNARAERLAVAQAISQITGVDMRIEALLWHLAERWGRVAPEGIVVGIALSHRMIGSLIGARRPTVSTAVSRLMDERRIIRRADGTWVLPGTPPSVAEPDADLMQLDRGAAATVVAIDSFSGSERRRRFLTSGRGAVTAKG